MKFFWIFFDLNGGLEKLLWIPLLWRLKNHCMSTSKLLWKQSYITMEKGVWRGNKWLVWWQVFLCEETCCDVSRVQLPLQLVLTCVQLPTFNKRVNFFLSESGNCTSFLIFVMISKVILRIKCPFSLLPKFCIPLWVFERVEECPHVTWWCL